MDYYRITAYHSEHDISVILDSNGRFETLWEFSSFLADHGFRIVFITKSDAIADAGCPDIEPSKKLAVRAIAKGFPESDDFIYQDRKCKAITVGSKVYVQYVL